MLRRMSAPSPPPVVNVAAYRFAPLDRLAERRLQLHTLGKAERLKGTILLSPEGINLFLAGSRDGVDRLLGELRSDPLLADLEVKESFSQRPPFNRLLVKLKREIIAFGQPGIDPRLRPAPRLSAVELKAWLDEGRPVTLLDTRNDYEIKLGTFKGAVPIGVDHFRDFPDAVRRLPEEMKRQPVVTFCTGGVRCEKAAPFLEREGFAEVYQLDGGILKYFEECGGRHYTGDCFVFDHRVALNARLEETPAALCFACQSPLSEADRRSDRYQENVCCPHCWRPPRQERRLSAEDVERRLREAATPLPGSRPYVNRRPLNVPRRYDGLSVLEFLCAYHPHVGRDMWRGVCAEGLLHHDGEAVAADAVVRGGQRLVRLEPDTVEPDVRAAVRVIAWTPEFAVFDKPAPLPMHPCGRFHHNTLTGLLERALPGEKLRPVHRLDANTTGLVLMARSRDAARVMQPQFEQGRARKTYVCRVHGRPDWGETTVDQPISRKPAAGGFRVIDANGDRAVTRLRLLESDGQTSLLRAEPVTGRTNQIRVHLWHLALPIVGDPTYRPGGLFGDTQTLSVVDDPMCLHAEELHFSDPTGRPQQVRAERPPWATLSEVAKTAL